MSEHLQRCPLCDTSFDAEGLGCRPSCPLAKRCTTVCCPNCGYSFPQTDAGLTGRLARWLRGRKEA